MLVILYYSVHYHLNIFRDKKMAYLKILIHNYYSIIYNYIYNFIVFAFFILIFGGGLYYCYKQKPTEYELHKKMLKDQQYILSKIRHYQHEKHNQTTSNITNLPLI